MNIRTITCFLDPGFPVDAERLSSMAETLAKMKSALEAASYTVQTVRLASVPFPSLLGADASQAVRFALELEALCFAAHIDYVTLGPVRLQDAPDFCRVIPEIIGATENVFASAIIADPAAGVSLPAVRLAADIIHRCATVTPDGFGNLRFAALANVPPGTPFFPAAYAGDGAPAFAIGVEAAPLAVSAFAEASSLAEARARLISDIELQAEAISGVVKKFTGWRAYFDGYCSVCGTGLDTLPLPGDTSPEALAAILADVGALALRLNKPLTARLMPIPGKQAGDEVKFDFQYFAPSRVLAPRASGLGGLFASAGAVDIAPRAR